MPWDEVGWNIHRSRVYTHTHAVKYLYKSLAELDLCTWWTTRVRSVINSRETYSSISVSGSWIISPRTIPKYAFQHGQNIFGDIPREIPFARKSSMIVYARVNSSLVNSIRYSVSRSFDFWYRYKYSAPRKKRSRGGSKSFAFASPRRFTGIRRYRHII